MIEPSSQLPTEEEAGRLEFRSGREGDHNPQAVTADCLPSREPGRRQELPRTKRRDLLREGMARAPEIHPWKRTPYSYDSVGVWCPH